MAIYPKTQVAEPVRPFRLWDAVLKKVIRYRYYGDRKRAHMAALVEARWSKIGTTIEVFDARNAKLLGQYTRKVNNIEFMGE